VRKMSLRSLFIHEFKSAFLFPCLAVAFRFLGNEKSGREALRWKTAHRVHDKVGGG
jgi:hypothetical protein